jgi:hypothetical protein
VATAGKPRPQARIRHKSYDIQQLVDGVERRDRGTAGPQNVAVYTFGSGKNRRVFTEKV